MTKNSLLSVTFITITSLALGACTPPSFMNSQNSPAPSATTETMSQTDNADTETMAAAMMTGASLRCTVSNQAKGESIEYVTKDKKMRVHSITTDNQNQNSNMINDTQYVYIWSDGETNGVKTAVPTEEEMQAAQQAMQNAQDSYNQEVPDFSSTTVQEDYQNRGYTIDCQPGAVSDTEFIPPATVQFQDMSAMMQNALNSMEYTNKAN